MSSGELQALLLVGAVIFAAYAAGYATARVENAQRRTKYCPHCDDHVIPLDNISTLHIGSCVKIVNRAE